MNEDPKANDDVYNFDEEEEPGEDASEEEAEAKGSKNNKGRTKNAKPKYTCNFCTYTSHRR